MGGSKKKSKQEMKIYYLPGYSRLLQEATFGSLIPYIKTPHYEAYLQEPTWMEKKIYQGLSNIMAQGGETTVDRAIKNAWLERLGVPTFDYVAASNIFANTTAVPEPPRYTVTFNLPISQILENLKTSLAETLTPPAPKYNLPSWLPPTHPVAWSLDDRLFQRKTSSRATSNWQNTLINALEKALSNIPSTITTTATPSYWY